MSLEDALDHAIGALDGSTVDGLEGRGPAHARRGRHELTPREFEVLDLLALGQSDGEIAATLFISKKTAAVHVGNIKGKLGGRQPSRDVTNRLADRYRHARP